MRSLSSSKGSSQHLSLSPTPLLSFYLVVDLVCNVFDLFFFQVVLFVIGRHDTDRKFEFIHVAHAAFATLSFFSFNVHHYTKPN